MTGKIVTIPELCEILDISPKSVRDMLISPSFPIHQKGHWGKPHYFDTAAVINWLKDRERNRAAKAEGSSALETAKARSATAAAEQRELDLSIKRGLYAPIADIMPLLAEEMIEFRSVFQGMPNEALNLFGADVSRWVETRHAEGFERVKTARQPITLERIEEFRNGR